MTARRLAHWTINLLVATFYVHFALAHWTTALMSGRWLSVAPFAAQETLLAGMFFVRREATYVSVRASDWIVGIAGTLLPLCIRAGGYWPHLAPMGQGLQLMGLAISMGALLSLRRSMGVVAAERGVTVQGLYRWIRHPMYLGHLGCLAGYLMLYPSARTVVLVGGTAWCMVRRMDAEERLLIRRSDAYWKYYHLVRWRMVPRVY